MLCTFRLRYTVKVGDLRRSRRLAALGLIATCLSLSSCLIPENVREYDAFLKMHVLHNPQIVGANLSIAGHPLHYRSVGQANRAVALWIHGTPGSWSDIGLLLADDTFTQQVRLVSMDRPGWGGSAEQAQDFELGSFAANSAAIGELLKRLKREHPQVPLIVAGHSWGGSIVPTIAADHANLVDGAIVLAASLDPQLAKPRWYNRLAAIDLVSALLGAKLRGANKEVFALPAQLTQQQKRLAQLRMPIVVIQGLADRLVHPKNADFAERHLDAASSRVIRLPHQGHLMQVEQTELIGRCILALADAVLADCQAN